MPYFRQFQHLLPQAKAWRLTIAKTLRSFFEGLAEVTSDARDFIDDVHGDLDPQTTRETAEWENQFGLTPASTATAQERRDALDTAWAAQGGQDPDYLQTIVQLSFPTLFVHEWWVPPRGSPWTARDPRSYTLQPLIGWIQCGEALAQCGEPTAQCNAFLANEPGYIVNRTLRDYLPPPPIPDDSDTWPYFLYWGGETFGDRVTIPETRKAELERLVLKLCPMQHWLVMLVDYDPGEGIFSDEFDFSFN